MAHLLLISSDETLYSFVEDSLQRLPACRFTGIRTSSFSLSKILNLAPSLVLIHLPAGQSAETQVLPLVQAAKAQPNPIPVLVVADEYHGRTFRDLLKSGAKECLTRPLDATRLVFFVRSLCLSSRGNRITAVSQLEQTVARTSSDFKTVCEKALRVAGKNMPLLLTGETGVGKTHLAKLIHAASPRRHEPFVVLNCGAISDTLAESELFGHRKGAFTGAAEEHRGHLAAAGKGTLLLDEIDSLSPGIQAKLLRALDERVFTPVGSVEEERFDARLITATNQSLETVVEENKFRKDLFFRIGVIELNIPPLRARKSEIRSLAACFLQQICSDSQQPTPTVPEETWRLLEEYNWPGNLRQLRNVLEHGLAFASEGILAPQFLPPLKSFVEPMDPINTPITSSKDMVQPGATPLVAARRQGERQQLIDMLRLYDFNKTRVAEALGISRNGLYKRLRTLNL